MRLVHIPSLEGRIEENFVLYKIGVGCRVANRTLKGATQGTMIVAILLGKKETFPFRNVTTRKNNKSKFPLGTGFYAIFLRPSLNIFASITFASSTTALLSLLNASFVFVGKIEMPL